MNMLCGVETPDFTQLNSVDLLSLLNIHFNDGKSPVGQKSS